MLDEVSILLEEALHLYRQEKRDTYRKWQDAVNRYDNARGDQNILKKYGGLIKDYEEKLSDLEKQFAAIKEQQRSLAAYQLEQLRTIMIQRIKTRSDITDTLDRPIEDLNIDEILELYSAVE